jgi:hypothetical protein
MKTTIWQHSEVNIDAINVENSSQKFNSRHVDQCHKTWLKIDNGLKFGVLKVVYILGHETMQSEIGINISEETACLNIQSRRKLHYK